jgi:hypothetical protein
LRRECGGIDPGEPGPGVGVEAMMQVHPERRMKLHSGDAIYRFSFGTRRTDGILGVEYRREQEEKGGC